MQKKAPKKWLTQLTTSKSQIRHCKICFEEIKDHSLYNSINSDSVICQKCFSNFKARFKKFTIIKYHALAIYDYDETIKKLLYTFKGCFDYELKDVFFDRYKTYLKEKYKGYNLVPIPSYRLDDEKRGFNHVKAMYESLGLPFIECLRKDSKYKQSDKNYNDRLKTEPAISLIDEERVNNKKILIVDDVYTTGSTIFKAITLLKTCHPKKIEILVMAKTIDLELRNKKHNI